MKQIILYIFLLLLLFACNNATTNKETTNLVHFDSGFSLYQDTIVVNIKGKMTHAFKYNNKFYVLFEQKVLKYGGCGKKWLYIFSDGEIEKIIDCPKKSQTFYLDFFIKNDSIILKPYMEDIYYYLDLQNFVWKEIDKTDDLIFEDEKFLVYSLDFGECGGKTWFKDKKTGNEYSIESTTPLINRIDTTYYITNSSYVLKIENPLKLNVCDGDMMYNNTKINDKWYFTYGNEIGYDIVYMDTVYNYYKISQQPYIVTSFVLQNEILHIYETDTAIYIAKIENNSIKTIQKIGENINFYNWYYSYRCRNLNGNNELLKFQTKDQLSFGLFDIVGNKIFQYYFINEAELEPKFYGTAKADSIFVNRFNLILSNYNNLLLSKVDLIEQTWKSFDITPNHKIGIGDSWNPNKYEIDTCKSYLIREDSIISNSIIYYATKANDLVRTILIDWDDESEMDFYLKDSIKEIFKVKIKFLENCITKQAGKPIEIESGRNFIKKIWKTSNKLNIELEIIYSNDYNRIRFAIYKN